MRCRGKRVQPDQVLFDVACVLLGKWADLQLCPQLSDCLLRTDQAYSKCRKLELELGDGGNIQRVFGCHSMEVMFKLDRNLFVCYRVFLCARHLRFEAADRHRGYSTSPTQHLWHTHTCPRGCSIIHPTTSKPTTRHITHYRSSKIGSASVSWRNYTEHIAPALYPSAD